jgi:uncharacterized protein
MDIQKQSLNFKNKVAIVSGATSSIGRQVALDLASLGCKLIIVGQDKDKLSKLKNELIVFDKNAVAISCDISNRLHVDEMAKQVIEKMGKVDILINAESIGKWKSFEDSTIENIEEAMKVNFLGTLYMTKAFLKTLREQEEGHIVNISSLAAFVGIPNLSGYCASKSAVLELSESIYNEFQDSRLNISCVCAGAINENSFEDLTIAGKLEDQHVNPELVSKEIINAMRTKKFLVIVPKKYRAILIAKGLSSKYVNRQARKRFSE